MSRLEPQLAWESGGDARFVSLSGDALSLVSTVSSPPGSRPIGTLLDGARERVRVKVHGCKAQGDGTFRLEGRLIDATRGTRARIATLVASAAVAPS
jgi:regulator of extracellular matrix RemA (YlzA/DUF370 family)